MELKTIRKGSAGPLVTRWQQFLNEQGLYTGLLHGTFDEATESSTKAFQAAQGLEADGVAGKDTFGAALKAGFSLGIIETTDRSGPHWPARPPFRALADNEARHGIFGKFSYVHHPVPGNSENIRITDNWARKNIISVTLPQLKKVRGNTTVSFHRLAADQLRSLWNDWEKAGLLDRVIRYDGDYVPRFVRGNRRVLSNHAFGSAFDINASLNPLKKVPPFVGQKGSVRELVSIAHQNGFYWGGHFNRLDGMHFEIAQILNQ